MLVIAEGAAIPFFTRGCPRRTASPSRLRPLRARGVRRTVLNFIRISVVGHESLLRMQQVLRTGAVAHSTSRIELADGVGAAMERSGPIAGPATPPMTGKPFRTNGLPAPCRSRP